MHILHSRDNKQKCTHENQNWQKNWLKYIRCVSAPGAFTSYPYRDTKMADESFCELLLVKFLYAESWLNDKSRVNPKNCGLLHYKLYWYFLFII